MPRLLEGIRILDLSRLVLGAAVTHHFADLGADVVKVEEPPAGDYIREVLPLLDGISVQHLLLDRAKRSIALDLGAAADRATFHELVRVADAIVTVSGQPAMVTRGADWEVAHTLNPGLVYLSFTGFGVTSAYAALPAHGSNLAGFAGVHGAERRDDGVFVPAPLPYGRYRIPMEAAALRAAFVLLAALHAVQRGGPGRFLDVSATEALMAGDAAAMTDTLAHGRSQLVDTLEPRARYGIYEAGDGKLLMVCAIEQRFWDRFCDVIGRDDLRDHGNWSEREMDFATGDLGLYRTIQETLRASDRGDWLRALVAARVPCSPINSVEEAAADPAVGGRVWREARHPQTGKNFRWMVPADEEDPGPAPAFGEHRAADVLAEWRAPRPD